jgi:hypothetical protein
MTTEQKIIRAKIGLLDCWSLRSSSAMSAKPARGWATATTAFTASMNFTTKGGELALQEISRKNPC